MNLLNRIFGKSSKSDSVAFQQYIALGDSISTDDYPGEGKGAASLLYKNQDHLFPEFKNKDARTLFPGILFLNLAADGASSADVLHEQLEKIPQESSRRTLFTLTAGGNDILGQEDAKQILFRLDTITKHLLSELPYSLILLGTVYDPTDGTGILFPDGEPLVHEMEVLKEVNDGIKEIAKHPAVELADIHSHFLGHGTACKDPNNPYYSNDDPSLWYVLNIEPNTRGAHEVRRVFWKALTSALE